LLTALACALVLASSLVPQVSAQTPKTVWDSHDDLMEWLLLADVRGGSIRGVEQLTEGSRDFVRIRWAEINATPFILNPNDENVNLFSGLEALATLANATVHNALRVTLRQTMGFDQISGVWFHRNGDYNESMANVPRFEPQNVPSDLEWREITLMFSDSPFFDQQDEIVALGFGLGDSAGKEDEKFLANRDTAVFDLDRIELVNVPEDIPTPLVTSIAPQTGPSDTVVTIQGSGFAEPASRNVVTFGGRRVEVLSGDDSTLVVRARGIGSKTVVVLRPGGKQAVAAQLFVGIGRPRSFEIVSGNNQVGAPGETLQPLVVQVADIANQGIVGLTVTFRIVSGGGVLSVEQVTTAQDGTASTVLTLGGTPGTVGVEAKVDLFRPKVFTATVAP